MSKSHNKTFFYLIFVALISLALNISLGSIAIPIRDIVNIIFGNEINDSSWSIIITNYRLPKLSAAVLAGSALGVSGLMMQTLFRNPMAGPFVLGINSGASLGVALLILGGGVLGSGAKFFLVSKWGLILASALGSFFTLVFVLAAAQKIKDIMAVLIIGLMVGSLSSAMVTTLSYFSSAEELQQFVIWGFGSLEGVHWEEIRFLSISVGLGLFLSVLTIKPLNVLLLGEDYATSLGIDIKKSRLLIVFSTSLLAGSVTAFVGPIAFIGLGVPHIARLIFKTSEHKILLPAVALLGIIVMCFCDSLTQWPGHSYTLPINAITSIVGAPLVIWLLIKKKRILR